MHQLSDVAASVWAKSSKHDLGWLPLWRHLDDSAAVASQLWDRWLPAATRHLIAEGLPDGEADGRRLVTWLAGVHDIGKATPAFAVRNLVEVRPLTDRMRDLGLAMPHDIPYQDRVLALHATAGQLLLERWLADTHGWERTQSRQFGIVVGGHHGVPPTDGDLLRAARQTRLLGLASDQQPWQTVHKELLDRAATATNVADRLPHWRTATLSQPVQVLLTGLVIVADWIASNEDLFPYDLDRLYVPSRLADAWDKLDLPTPWQAVTTASPPEELYAGRFTLPSGATVRPIQTAAVDIARTMPDAGLLIIEAPMGEGKTEAALAAAEQLAARCGAGGCFVALPTRATSDAMFARIRKWLARLPDADQDAGAFALTLAHGKARFNDDFDALMRGYVSGVDIDAPAGGRELAAHRWLTGRKKAMLASFVVGTIDQLLFAALKSRHLALRHLGLAGKVVIIDEAHAYDVYMSRYLDRALEWLAAYRVPTIVLSATLPARRRKEMIRSYDRGRGLAPPPPSRPSWKDRAKDASKDPLRDRGSATSALDPYAVLDGDIGYPVLTASGVDGRPVVTLAKPSGREVNVALGRLDETPAALADLLRTELADGGCALVVRNTVRRVQETAADLRQAFAGTRLEVSVAHSRFLAPDRAEKDRWLREAFGPPEQMSSARPSGHVVVASQVAEQSLDIDFDLLVTDLAPVDLVLQRAGRLHRHQRGTDQSQRPPRLRQARCLITGVDWASAPPEPPASPESWAPPEPIAGSRLVYGRYPLLRSLAVLHPYLTGERTLRLPADIAPLVQAAYGDAPVGPAGWQDAMAAERRDHAARLQQKERKAEAFRLAASRPDGEAVVGWLDANVGDADDDPRLEGRAQVRDTPAESVEVLVLLRRADGSLVTPPWLRRGGGREVPTEFAPPGDLARTVATCTLALPIQLCRLEAIEELERKHTIGAWQESPWLAGELVLVLDEDGEAELYGHRLRYDRHDGLAVSRLAA